MTALGADVRNLGFARSRFTPLIVVAIGVCTLAMTRPVHAADESPVRMKRTNVEAAELSLTYPSHWVRFSLTDEDLESLGEALDAENPEISESVGRLDTSALKLNVHDPIDGDSVLVQAGSGALIGGKKLIRAMLETQLGEVPGFEMVRMRDVSVGDKRGIRAEYRYQLAMSEDEGDVLPVYEIAIFLSLGDGEIASVDIAVDDEPADVAMAHRIAGSLRGLE
jgi:hypothetical protein